MIQNFPCFFPDRAGGGGRLPTSPLSLRRCKGSVSTSWRRQRNSGSAETFKHGGWQWVPIVLLRRSWDFRCGFFQQDGSCSLTLFHRLGIVHILHGACWLVGGAGRYFPEFFKITFKFGLLTYVRACPSSIFEQIGVILQLWLNCPKP